MSVKKGSWAQGEVKPLRKRGLKVQSPISGTGVILDSKKQQKILTNTLLSNFSQQQVREKNESKV